MPCTPEELQRLAELQADNKVGESAVSTVRTYEEEGIGTHTGAEVRRKMGWLFPFRIQRAVFGDEFTAKVLNSLQIGVQRQTNTESRYYKQFNDIMADAFDLGYVKRLVGPSTEQLEQVTKALEMTDAMGNFTGPRASMPDNVVKAAQGVRRLYNQAFTDFGLDPEIYLNMYAPHRRANPQGSFWDPNPSPILETIRNHIDPSGIRFLAELERKGTLTAWDMNAATAFKNYI